MKLPRYAKIDLSTGEISSYKISEREFCDYLGGKGLAAKILYDLLPPGIEPLSPENILVINTSPLTGSGAPSSSRFNVSCKSPLTMGIASSNCGGTFGIKLRQAGYDGLIICGKASSPVIIQIFDGEIKISPASEYWGMDTEEVQKRFDHRFGKLFIGPAGENLVRYACAVSGERVAGRCGVGAVMGSKNLKGLVAYGTLPVPIEREKEFRKHVNKWIAMLKKHPSTGTNFPKYGTAWFLKRVNSRHVLPVNNFSSTPYQLADEISGEKLAEEHLTRNSGCVSCPIRCERRVMVAGKEVKGPEYETVGLFGANMENPRLDLISLWNYKADLLGMDTISLAGTLAFARELEQKGLADFGISGLFPVNVEQIIEDIAYRRGKTAELADGSRILAKKYGGQDFAIQVKGLELAAYDPRGSVGLGLGYATANRGGCHLNGGFLTFLEVISPLPLDPASPSGKAALTVFFQNGIEAVSSGGSCLFTTFTVIPAFLFKTGEKHVLNRILAFIMHHSSSLITFLLHHTSLLFMDLFTVFPHVKAIRLASGIPLRTGDFLRAGERSFTIERLFNLRECIGAEQDSLPGRLVNEKSHSEGIALNGVMPELIAEYYRIRQWTPDGKPSPRLLQRLGIKGTSQGNKAVENAADLALDGGL